MGKGTLVVGERDHAAGGSDVVGGGQHVHVVLVVVFDTAFGAVVNTAENLRGMEEKEEIGTLGRTREVLVTMPSTQTSFVNSSVWS